VIYHAALPEDWDAARGAGTYEVSTRGVALADAGFIHAAYAGQIEGVANRFYADVEELVLLSIDRGALGVPVIDESPTGDPADELFPHLFGPLPVDAVVDARRWTRQPGQTWGVGSVENPDQTGRV
jgi:glutathione S-transferase